MGAAIVLFTDRPKPFYTYSDVVQLLPEEKKALLRQDKDANRAMDYALYGWIRTQAGYHLDSSCRSALALIITRTYTYRKQAELISIRQFREGVFNAKGQSVCSPALANDRATYRALDILEGRKLIVRQRVTINGADVVSLIRPCPSAILTLIKTHEENIVLRQPRAKKPAQNNEFFDEETVLSIDSTPLLSIDSTEYIKEELSKRSKTDCDEARNVKRISRTRNAIDCKAKVLAVIAKAQDRSTKRVEEKARRGPADEFPLMGKLLAMWKVSMATTYDVVGIAAINAQHYGKFRRMVKNQEVRDWQDLLTWAVKNWEAMNRKQKELAAYKKRQGEWSTADERKVYLGTATPDLFSFTMNFAKIFSKYLEARSKPATAEAPKADNDALVIQLAATKRMLDAERATLVRLQRVQRTDLAAERPKTPIRVVNPVGDTFFEGGDEELPEWGA